MNCKAYPSGAVLYEIPYFVDTRGAINILEIKRDLPFECQRVFYTYAVPQGSIRGEHAHRRCEQLLISVRGAITVKVDDGLGRRDEIVLDSPSQALWLPHGHWGEQLGHSEDNILLVLASRPYESEDYIRDYGEFLQWKRDGGR